MFGGSLMKKDVVIIGAGPAGIFTALEMIQPFEHETKSKKKKSCHTRQGILGNHRRAIFTEESQSFGVSLLCPGA